MIRTDCGYCVVSVLIEVVIDSFCCNGEVVTMFVEWCLVHMMDWPFVHSAETLIGNTTQTTSLICDTHISCNLLDIRFINDLFANIAEINVKW